MVGFRFGGELPSMPGMGGTPDPRRATPADDIRAERRARMAEAAEKGQTAADQNEVDQEKDINTVFEQIDLAREDISAFRKSDKARRVEESYGKSFFGRWNAWFAGATESNPRTGQSKEQPVIAEVGKRTLKVVVKTAITTALGALAITGLAALGITAATISAPVLIGGAVGAAAARGIVEAVRLISGKERKGRGEIEAANEAVYKEVERLAAEIAVDSNKLALENISNPDYRPEGDPDLQAKILRILDLMNDDTKRRVVVEEKVDPNNVRSGKRIVTYRVLGVNESPAAGTRVINVAEAEKEQRDREKKGERWSDWMALIGSIGGGLIGKALYGAGAAAQASAEAISKADKALEGAGQYANFDTEPTKHLVKYGLDENGNFLKNVLIYLKEPGLHVGNPQDLFLNAPHDTIVGAEHWHLTGGGAQELLSGIGNAAANAEVLGQWITLAGMGAAGLVQNVGNESWNSFRKDKYIDENKEHYAAYLSHVKNILPKPPTPPAGGGGPAAPSGPELPPIPVINVTLVPPDQSGREMEAKVYRKMNPKHAVDLTKGGTTYRVEMTDFALASDDNGTDSTLLICDKNGNPKFGQAFRMANSVINEHFQAAKPAEAATTTTEKKAEEAVAVDEDTKKKLETAEMSDEDFIKEMKELFAGKIVEIKLDNQNRRVISIGASGTEPVKWTAKRKKSEGNCTNANNPNNGVHLVKISDFELAGDKISITYELEQKTVDGFEHAGFLISTMTDEDVEKGILAEANKPEAERPEIILLDPKLGKWRVAEATADGKLKLIEVLSDGKDGTGKATVDAKKIKKDYIEWFTKAKTTVDSADDTTVEPPPEAAKLPKKFTDKFTEAGKTDSTDFDEALDADFDARAKGDRGGRVVVVAPDGAAKLVSKTKADEYTISDFDPKTLTVVPGGEVIVATMGKFKTTKNAVNTFWREKGSPKTKSKIDKDEAEKKRKADEDEQKRLADEKEKKRIADEAEKKRLADEAEKKRKEDEAAAKIDKDLAELKIGTGVSFHPGSTLPIEGGAVIPLDGVQFRITATPNIDKTAVQEFGGTIIGGFAPIKKINLMLADYEIGEIKDVPIVIDVAQMRAILAHEKVELKPIKLEKKVAPAPPPLPTPEELAAAALEKRLEDLEVGDKVPLADGSHVRLPDGTKVSINGTSISIKTLPDSAGGNFRANVAGDAALIEAINTQLSAAGCVDLTTQNLAITKDLMRTILRGGSINFAARLLPAEPLPPPRIDPPASDHETGDSGLTEDETREIARLRAEIEGLQQEREKPAEKLQVIGDVHGDLEKLKEIIDSTADKCIFTGDFIDRGPNSKGVLEKLKEMVESGKAEFTLGNHDAMFIGAMEGDLEALFNWACYGNGGDKMLAEFGIDAAPFIARTKGRHPSDPVCAAALKDLHDAILAGVPALKSWADWLKQNGNFVIVRDGTLFTHGEPTAENGDVSNYLKALEMQDAMHRGELKFDAGVWMSPVIWNRGLSDNNVQETGHEQYIADLIEAINKNLDGKHKVVRVVHGHTPDRGGKSVSYAGGKVINVDAGMTDKYGGFGGSLYIDSEGIRFVPRTQKDQPRIIDTRKRTVADTDRGGEIDQLIPELEAAIAQIEEAARQRAAEAAAAAGPDNDLGNPEYVPAISIEQLQQNIPDGYRLYARADLRGDEARDILSPVVVERVVAGEVVGHDFTTSPESKPLIYGDGTNFWLIKPEGNVFNKYRLDLDFRPVGDPEVLTGETEFPDGSGLYIDKTPRAEAEAELNSLEEGDVVSLGYNVRLDIGGGRSMPLPPSIHARIAKLERDSSGPDQPDQIQYFDIELIPINVVEAEDDEFEEEAELAAAKYSGFSGFRLDRNQILDILIGNNVMLDESNGITVLAEPPQDDGQPKPIAELPQDDGRALPGPESDPSDEASLGLIPLEISSQADLDQYVSKPPEYYERVQVFVRLNDGELARVAYRGSTGPYSVDVQPNGDRIDYATFDDLKTEAKSFFIEKEEVSEKRFEAKKEVAFKILAGEVKWLPEPIFKNSDWFMERYPGVEEIITSSITEQNISRRMNLAVRLDDGTETTQEIDFYGALTDFNPIPAFNPAILKDVIDRKEKSVASGGAEQPPSGINQPDSLSDAKPIPVVVPSPEQSDLEDLAKLAELENDARAAGTAEQGKTLEIRAAELLKDGTAMVLRPDAPDRPSGYGVVAGDKPHETEVRPIRAGKTYYFEKFVDPSDPSKGAIIRTAKSKSGEKIYMKNSLLLKILVPEELLPELAPKPAADEGTLLPKLGDTDESTKNSLGI